MLQEMEPHAYALAEAAFRGMLVELKPQALLISGESGAGKTEAVKACLRYIVARSSGAAVEHSSGDGEPGARTQRAKYVEDCIMQANPLLEALGNAKTVRNGNSSRFGKWIEIQFDTTGFITASKITSYLLEKSRVTECARGERTYHSLYQLCRGATAEQRTHLQLIDLQQFHYIGDSAAVQVSTVDDVQWWHATCHAMDVFGVRSDDQADVRKVLASVLHVGNLGFDVLHIASQDDGSKVTPSSQPSLLAVAALLGLTPEALEQALTVKSVGKFPVVLVPVPPSKADSTRDALAKALYSHLFDWAIGRINITMGASGASVSDAKRTIGMLDIFGFEAFQRNSLEQLLINFANEKLQSHFNEYIFKLEEAECAADGVTCPKLEFADNSAVMTLMTAKPTGVLSLVNEEVIVPNGSDDKLLQKLNEKHRSNSCYKVMPRAQGDGFAINHYAGNVSYHIDGFVDKNRDQMPGELMQLLSSSQLPLMEALFKQAGADEPPKSARGGGARARSGGGSGKRPSALAAQFADSLDSLMGVLSLTTPHFIRCVKPNFQQAPDELDGGYVMRQLKEMGMVQVVKARKQGFAHRYPFDRFISRYGYLLKGRETTAAELAPFYAQHLGTSAPPEGDRKESVTVIAAMVGDGVVAAEGWAIGTTKVFLTEEQQQQLEVAREAYLLKVVTQQLQQAIEQREVPVLESAIASAIEVQLQSPLVMQAQQLLTLLQAQLRAVAQLTDAIERRDTSMLDAALLAASQVGLAQHPLVGQAQQLLATLKAQQQATASLADALSRNDASHIATALAECERAGLNTGLMKEAQRRLDTLRRTAELEHHLELATAEDDLGTLGQLLAQAEEISLDTLPVQRAKARRTTLQEALQLQEALTNAMEASDSASLRAILERSSTVPSPPAELKRLQAAAQQALESFEAQAAARAAAEAQERKRAEEEAAAAARAEATARAEAAKAAEEAAARAAANAEAAANADAANAQQLQQAAAVAAANAAATPRGSRSLNRALSDEDVWVASTEGGRSLPCQSIASRIQQLQAGCKLIKVAPAKDRWKERGMPASRSGVRCTSSQSLPLQRLRASQ